MSERRWAASRRVPAFQRRSGRATPADRDTAPQIASLSSDLRCREPSPRCPRDGFDGLEAQTQRLFTTCGETIRIPAVLRNDRLDQTSRLEPRNCAIECSGPESDVRQLCYVLSHRIAVLRRVRETYQDQQGGV